METSTQEADKKECDESYNLMLATIGRLNDAQSEALVEHIQQCDICRKMRIALAEAGKTYDRFDRRVFFEWSSDGATSSPLAPQSPS